MRYRKLAIDRDYVFGHGANDFYIDRPETVGQAVLTRLGLTQGEWFLDTTIGTPYNSQVIGKGTAATYDLAIKEVINNTAGVKQIDKYYSYVSPSRVARVVAVIDTVYGSMAVMA